MTLSGDILYEDQLKYEVQVVKGQKTQLQQWVEALDILWIVANFGGLVDFRLKMTCHPRVTLRLGQRYAFLKNLDGAR